MVQWLDRWDYAGVQIFWIRVLLGKSTWLHFINHCCVDSKHTCMSIQKPHEENVCSCTGARRTRQGTPGVQDIYYRLVGLQTGDLEIVQFCWNFSATLPTHVASSRHVTPFLSAKIRSCLAHKLQRCERWKPCGTPGPSKVRKPSLACRRGTPQSSNHETNIKLSWIQ